MLREFRKKLIHSFEQSQYFREKYLQLAIFCSNHGVEHPFSAGRVKTERGFRKQDSHDPQRMPYLYTKYDDAVGLLFEDVLPFLEKDSNILEIGCNADEIYIICFLKVIKI